MSVDLRFVVKVATNLNYAEFCFHFFEHGLLSSELVARFFYELFRSLFDVAWVVEAGV